jgi:CDP-diacylglycerol--inositol 3-phosphatidyltransferase
MVSVYLFVPNLIGYFRIIATAVAYAVAADQPNLFLVLYTLAFVLDAADGMAARALGQCSRFGAILDMVTDRAATSGFLCILAGLLGPSAHVPAAGLIALDIMSHMVRMFSSLALGDKSHKDYKSPFPFLNLYYGKRMFMGTLCVGQEFCYLFLYAWHFWPHLWFIKAALYVLVPLCIGKQWANVEQLAAAFMRVAEVDENEIAEAKAARAKGRRAQ